MSFASDAEVAASRASSSSDNEECGASSSGHAGSQSRFWVFTINNPDHTDETLWDWLISDRKFDIEAGVFQMETGAEGTPHAQGYFKVKGKLKRQACVNKFRGVGWIEICKNIDKAILYCSKEETRDSGPFWYGGLSAGVSGKTQGRRTDLKRFAEGVLEGESMEKLAKEDPVTYVRNTKGLYALQQLMIKPKVRDFMTELHIKWGVSGCGKSWAAFNDYGKDIYVLPKAKPGTVFWWPRYHGQENVVIDDYNGWICLEELKKLVDRYPYQVRESQDRWVEFTSKRIIITSNMNWTAWYATEFMKAETQKGAFERRITTCKEYTVKYAGDQALVQSVDDSVVPVAPAAPRAQEETELLALEDDVEVPAEGLSPLGRAYLDEAEGHREHDFLN